MSQQAKREAMRRVNNLNQDTFVTTWRPASSFGMPETASLQVIQENIATYVFPHMFKVSLKHCRFEAEADGTKRKT